MDESTTRLNKPKGMFNVSVRCVCYQAQFANRLIHNPVSTICVWGDRQSVPSPFPELLAVALNCLHSINRHSISPPLPKTHSGSNVQPGPQVCPWDWGYVIRPAPRTMAAPAAPAAAPHRGRADREDHSLG